MNVSMGRRVPFAIVVSLVAFGVNVDTPLYNDGHLFLFGTWARGTTKSKLIVKANACSVEQIRRTPELNNEHGGVMLVDAYLYGQADGMLYFVSDRGEVALVGANPKRLEIVSQFDLPWGRGTVM